MSQSILVIDDSPDIHKILDVRLRSEGAILHHALEAREGIRMARELQPDLVLLDVDMPDVTGFEVCRILKGDPVTASLPIIFLTGATDVFAKVRGFDSGAVDYVTKPFDVTELTARVRAALRTKGYQDLLTARCDLDPLTGLWNRGYFDKRLKDEVSAARRYHRDVSLIMLDIDHFKVINDRRGHPVGDRVIEAVGALLRSASRDTDAACRYGGEEFGLILTHTKLDSAVQTAERLRAQVERLTFHVKDPLVTITASFGVADVATTPDRSTSEAIVRAADDALYAAKASGRNCVHAAPEREAIFSPLAAEPNMAALVAEFVHQLPEWMLALRARLDAADLEVTCRLLHQLKGAAGLYGFPAITSAAVTLEKALASASTDVIRVEMDCLSSLCARARGSAIHRGAAT